MATVSVTPNPDVRFRVAMEDYAFLIADKPAGVPTQPGKGHERDTLLNGLFAVYGPRLQNLGAARDFGLLHRLDRMASGLVLVGLTPRGYDTLRAAFAERRIEKRYWAVIFGKPSRQSAVIRGAIVETTDQRGRKVARVVRGRVRGAKPAATAYRVLSASDRASLIECRIGSGRLHQIRAHLESIGHPLAGDEIYGEGPARRLAPRLALHACLLAFAHPETGAEVRAVSPWPTDLVGATRRLGLAIPRHAAESAEAPVAPETPETPEIPPEDDPDLQ